MLASILLGLKTLKGIPEKYQGRWKTLAGLMLFFLAGYLAFIVIQVYRLDIPTEVIVGLIFLVGAFFVYFVIRLTHHTIDQLKSIQDELEERVEKRTENLHWALEKLKKEIHERKETVRELENVNTELNQILNSSADGIQVIDKNLIIRRVNHTFAELTGIPEEELIGVSCREVGPVEICGEDNCAVRQILSGEDWVEAEVEITSRDGVKIPCLVTAYPYLSPERELVGVVQGFRDITERKKIEARLREISVTDELTGLLNRRGFISMGESQLEFASRFDKNLLLLYGDLDEMKWINDNLGHAVGDQALIEVADILRSTFRKSDLIGIGRLGGDEFAALLFSEPDETCHHPVLDRLEKRIAERNAEQDREYNVSMSVGIVEYDPENPCSIEELIEKGDKAMYHCKREKKMNNSDQ